MISRIKLIFGNNEKVFFEAKSALNANPTNFYAVSPEAHNQSLISLDVCLKYPADFNSIVCPLSNYCYDAAFPSAQFAEIDPGWGGWHKSQHGK